MSNPSGDALMARIKELEEALRECMEVLECSYYSPYAEAAAKARKALNGNQT